MKNFASITTDVLVTLFRGPLLGLLIFDLSVPLTLFEALSSFYTTQSSLYNLANLSIK